MGRKKQARSNAMARSCISTSVIRRPFRTHLLQLVVFASVLSSSSIRAQSVTENVFERTVRLVSNAKSLAFTYTATNIPFGLTLPAVSNGRGILRADTIVFDGNIQYSRAISMPFAVVSCGDKQHLDLGDGVFQPMEGAPNIGKVLLSSDASFLINLLKQFQTSATPTKQTLNKQDVWYAKAGVASLILEKLPSRAPTVHGDVQAEIWINQQTFLLEQIVLTGPLFTGDTGKTSRTLVFARFNEPIELKVPRGKMPCVQ